VSLSCISSNRLIWLKSLACSCIIIYRHIHWDRLRVTPASRIHHWGGLKAAPHLKWLTSHSREGRGRHETTLMGWGLPTTTHFLLLLLPSSFFFIFYFYFIYKLFLNFIFFNFLILYIYIDTRTLQRRLRQARDHPNGLGVARSTPSSNHPFSSSSSFFLFFIFILCTNFFKKKKKLFLTF
jgi:hypothetical protein